VQNNALKIFIFAGKKKEEDNHAKKPGGIVKKYEKSILLSDEGLVGFAP
jgi:hypothetical protein